MESHLISAMQTIIPSTWIAAVFLLFAMFRLVWKYNHTAALSLGLMLVCASACGVVQHTPDVFLQVLEYR